MTTQRVDRVPISGVLARRGLLTVAPYALITAYYVLIFAARGLHGGDIDECITPGAQDKRDYGACPNFGGPLHANPWHAAVLRYHAWSSRFVVELVEYGLSHTLWLFVVITIALTWLFLRSAKAILQIRSPLGLTVFAALFCALIPPQFHWNAGVYSTMIFYSWTTYLALFAVAVIVRRIRREPVSRPLTWATVAALVFALCSEQIVVAFLFALGAIAYQVLIRRRNDLRAALVTYSALWVGAVANILLCPGNSIRQAREINYWMPNFTHESIPEKLTTGLHHAFWMLARTDSANITLVAALAAILLVSARRTGTSYLPGAAVAAWLIALVIITALGADLSRHAATTIIAVALLAVPAIRGGIDVTRRDQSARVMIIIALLAGFASSMVLSFSPTIWASDTRTLLVEYLAIGSAVFLLARCASRHAAVPLDLPNGSIRSL